MLLALAVTLTGSQLSAQAARPAESAVRAALDAANTRWQAAVRAGNAAGFANEFADDAVFLVPAAPAAKGRAAIERSTREWLAAVKVDSVRLARSDLRLTGDIAIEVGVVRTYTTPKGGGKSTGVTANYLTVWQRQASGAWKIVRDMTSPAPATP